MNCADIKLQLLDHRRDRLSAKAHHEVRAHLEACSSCARTDEAERALSEVLESRLPQHPATPGLKRRLAALVAVSAPAQAPHAPLFRFPVARWLAPALAAGLLATTIPLIYDTGAGRGSELALLASEAVNDHLRVLNSQRRVEVESGGPHQVKPWFQGKLDFAPNVPELPTLALQGGSVGYFKDRKAAVIVYTLGLHTVTLLELRAGDLAWPSDTREVRAAADRRFNVFFWRDGDLGYALVSDADPNELGALAREIAAMK